MNRELSLVAAMMCAAALFLSTRAQTFTRVSVEGRTARMLVTGSGDATVVFENGLGPPLEMWGKVQPRVSRFARTVTYDRTGVELHDALRLARIPPPYVLVGASLGARYVRGFAQMYPEEVSGIVLVDPTHDPARLELPPGVPLTLIDAIGPRDVPFATDEFASDARTGVRKSTPNRVHTSSGWIPFPVPVSS